ncbi:MAG: hypothetical protein K2M12_07825, partial [Muribaculaceae bacterium]|nr:hypothetical protein [Muribaculaceae bacterium]
LVFSLLQAKKAKTSFVFCLRIICDNRHSSDPGRSIESPVRIDRDFLSSPLPPRLPAPPQPTSRSLVLLRLNLL